MLETATHMPMLASDTTTTAASSAWGIGQEKAAAAGGGAEAEVVRGEVRNRARFEAALAGILGADLAPRGAAAGRLYEVFVAYFLHQALHHDKALSAHRLTLTLLGDPTAPEKGRRLKYSMVVGDEREPNAFLQALRAAALSSSSSGSVPTRVAAGVGEGTPFLQSDEKFFGMATAWLGDDLCLALKALLRRVEISFVATRFLGAGKKIWVNWEWVGSLHGDSSAFPLGSNERWTTATARALQPGAAASSSSGSHAPPPYHPLRMEAGTPEEGGLLSPHSATAARAATASSPSLQSPSSTASFADVSTASAFIPETVTTTTTTSGAPVMLHSGSYIPATNEPALLLASSSSLASGAPLSYGHTGPVAFLPASTPVAMAKPGGIPLAALASSQSAVEHQPALKEKRSLGKKLTRRFHKLTHHHHHEDPQQQ